MNSSGIPAGGVALPADRAKRSAANAQIPSTRVSFYLQHTPGLRHLNPLRPIPGTGYHSGRRSPSPISDSHRLDVHVARPCYGSSHRCTCVASPTPQFP